MLVGLCGMRIQNKTINTWLDMFKEMEMLRIVWGIDKWQMSFKFLEYDSSMANKF